MTKKVFYPKTFSHFIKVLCFDKESAAKTANSNLTITWPSFIHFLSLFYFDGENGF